jgi:hypothetical protein
MRRTVAALLACFVILAQPASVAATAYSALTYSFTWTPAGYPQTSLCQQAGEVDVNRNNGTAQSRSYNTSCAGSARTLPSGWLGINLDGYRDGAFCGSSGYYYSSSATWSWTLWVTLCSNPSGTQSFTTKARGVGYDGSSGYWSGATTTSPAQNY